MDEAPKSKIFVQDYVQRRAYTKEAQKTPFGKHVLPMKELDTYVSKFVSILREDVKSHNAASLKAHAKDFEAQIHDEIQYLFRLTKEDLDYFMRVLKALALYRAELGTLLKDDTMKSLAVSELHYADLLMREAGEKIETLQLLFKKLKQ